MVTGSVAAHAVGYVVAPATAEGADRGRELSGFHERASHGYAGHAVLWLGLIGAIAAVMGIRAFLARVRGRDSRHMGAGCFFLLPPLAYSSQELIERLLHAESFPFHAVLEPSFLLGLALQFPFAAIAFLVGWALFQTGKRLIRFLERDSPRRLHGIAARTWAPASVTVPRVRALSRGHPLRGPPLLA